MRVRLRAALAAAAALACDAGSPPPAPPSPAAPAEAPAEYVGRERCAGCHPDEVERYRGSHHDLAMQPATEATVLGDFDDRSFSAFGVTTRFRREGDRFVVNTEDAEGNLRDFEVAYTFGADPLQQYLLPMPGGRLQALGIAWDARPAEEGGQRWFSLHPDEPIPPGDVLHWTGPAQNWNFMCADCHSTDYRRGYDADADAYQPRWAELDVSCEACHGPASGHVAWAEAGARGDDARLVVDLRNRGSWSLPPGAAIASRAPLPGPSPEHDVCGRCHARRALIAEGFAAGQPLLDAYHPALLDEGLYTADGQIDDEVYVWGSFRQSRMYAAGVVCSDCHDPHSLSVGAQPDDACGRCHAPAVFASSDHHGHGPESAGASCVACHMPERTYMGIDGRRDHGLRPPRPAHSAALGAPDACTGCHDDRSPGWAQAALERWGVDAGPPPFGDALAAGRRAEPGAGAALAALAGDSDQPGIARATALRLLGDLPGAPAVDAILAAAGDPDPLVRMAAAGAAEGLPPEARPGIARLLRDPIRAVRIEAGRVLADTPAELFGPGERAALARVLGEYRAAQAAAAERPEAHVNLGILESRLGNPEAAERSYRTALRVGPYFVPAYVNLADLYRSLGREDEGLGMLRAGLERAPEEAGLHHALGLALVRAGRMGEALQALRRAAELDPDSVRYGYVYGVALSSEDPAAALDYLAAVHERHPGDPAVLVGLATLSRDAGRGDQALLYARRLAALMPDDASARTLVEELEARQP